MPMTNKKSDVKAKNAYVELLKNKGYQASVVNSPADIKATKDGQDWYFEIKMTKRSDVYFGAATLTEWKQAFADPDHFRFVVAVTDEAETEFKFIEYTPEEFLAFSSIPPFKVYFNINLNGKERRRKSSSARKSPATKLTKANFELMERCFDKLSATNKAQ